MEAWFPAEKVAKKDLEDGLAPNCQKLFEAVLTKLP
jgi:hypothetical protein